MTALERKRVTIFVSMRHGCIGWRRNWQRWQLFEKDEDGNEICRKTMTP